MFKPGRTVRDLIVGRYLSKPKHDAFSFEGGKFKVTGGDALSAVLKVREFLKGYDVTQNSGVIAVLHDQSPIAYLTQVALFLQGITYVIIDRETSPERFSRIIARLKIFAVLAFEPNDQSRESAVPVIRVSESVATGPLDPGDSSFPPIDPFQIAYIVLTSGSTGDPKAVSISHANLDHFVVWALDTFGLSSGDVFATLNPPHFDNAIFDFYCSQSSGGTLAVIPAQSLQEPTTAADLISEAGCTVWFSVPSLLVFFLRTKAMTPEFLHNFTKILFGGEGFPMKHLQEFWAMVEKSKSRVWNVYGPSECACMCSAHEVGDLDIDLDEDFAPIGKISEYFDFELLNQDSQGAGELVLYGPQVGPGYIGDEPSSRNFISRLIETSPGMTRGYKTGDIMRIDNRGLLRFVGRTDSQVKVMGHRIELAAIEAEILRIASCWESFVSIVQGASGNPFIHAWVATARSPEEIREALKTTLPAYMIPRRIYCMSSLPKNRSGKIDRLLLRQSVS